MHFKIILSQYCRSIILCIYNTIFLCWYNNIHGASLVTGASLVVQLVKNPSANAGDVRDTGFIPGLEDPLQKEVATCSIILAWKTAWTEKPGRL